MNDVIDLAQEAMDQSLEALKGHLGKLRTGRASLAILDKVKVDYYGTLSPLSQVATLAIPEPRLITIQPWEANLIPEIERAIDKANLGLNANNDGKLIRLPIPPLTEDRRKDIVKQLKAYGEECRVSIRHARKEANDELKQKQKASEITEDDLHKGADQVQKITDGFVAKSR